MKFEENSQRGMVSNLLIRLDYSQVRTRDTGVKMLSRNSHGKVRPCGFWCNINTNTPTAYSIQLQIRHYLQPPHLQAQMLLSEWNSTGFPNHGCRSYGSPLPSSHWLLRTIAHSWWWVCEWPWFFPQQWALLCRRFATFGGNFASC